MPPNKILAIAGATLGFTAAGLATVGLCFWTGDQRALLLFTLAFVLFGVGLVLGVLASVQGVPNPWALSLQAFGSQHVRPAARRLFLPVVFGVILVLAAIGLRNLLPLLEPRKSAPPQTPDWLVTGTGMTEGISGLALVEHDARHTVLLAVHDNKVADQPRLSLFTYRPGGKEVERQPVAWPGTPPIDLEAICLVPGKPSEFLTLSSRGDLYRVKLNEPRNAVTVEGTGRLVQAAKTDGGQPVPSEKVPSPEFEGFDVRLLDGQLIACWAQRGDMEKPAVVFGGLLDLEKLSVASGPGVSFTTPWPVAATRHISDLRLTETGAVLAISTSDPGNKGPFASALYLVGRIDAKTPTATFVRESSPARLWQDHQHKVEALETVGGATGGWVMGTDDEASGGAVSFGWK